MATKPNRNTIYFASDFHLGLQLCGGSKEREKRILLWLDQIKEDATDVYLLGDLFDYWFEYKEVTPKGYVRFIGKLAELSDLGIKLHIFTGNHDMWMFRYFEEEIGAKMYRKPISIELQGKKLHLGHGDGLGPGDHGYKFIKRVFNNPVNKWLFARIHPNTGIKIMRAVSNTSRENYEPDPFMGPDKEWLIIYCEKLLTSSYFDYFIFGHRHLALDYTLSNGKSRYINCGDWIKLDSYAYMKEGLLTLTSFTQ